MNKPTHCSTCNEELSLHDYESGNVMRDILLRPMPKHNKCPEIVGMSIMNSAYRQIELSQSDQTTKCSLPLTHTGQCENIPIGEYRPGTGFRMLDVFINSFNTPTKVASSEFQIYLYAIKEALIKDLENEYRAGHAAGFKLAGGGE